MRKIQITLLVTAVVTTVLGSLTAAMRDARSAVLNTENNPAIATIDYPLNGSIFPPEITPPTFLWRDAAEAIHWRIEIKFADGSAAMRFDSAGPPLSLGEIDPRCISANNELPKLTPMQAAAHTWTPDTNTWEKIKKHSVTGPAQIIITGLSRHDPKHELPSGQVSIQTSKDPVGAPIFYRDVPLMPSETEKGVIKPLAADAIPLIHWRLRSIDQPQSRVLLEGMHTCANCHSFSTRRQDHGHGPGRTAERQGPVCTGFRQAADRHPNKDMVSWNPSQDRQFGSNRVGFMSQVSPDGQYVLTMVSADTDRALKQLLRGQLQRLSLSASVLSDPWHPGWYNRATGERHSLPGADDPRFVQTNGVWSPDGKYMVFARAEAQDAYPAKGKNWRSTPTIPTRLRSNTIFTASRSTAARAARRRGSRVRRATG